MKRLILVFTVVSCSASEVLKVAEPIVSHSATVEESAKSRFIMEDFFVLNEGHQEESYWPTRHRANPFLQEEALSNSFLEDLRSEPRYAYQAKPGQLLRVKDAVHGKSYQSDIIAKGNQLLVGPTRQGWYAYSAYGNELHILRKLNDHLETEYVHRFATTDQITTVTMDTDAGYFYVATVSGQVRCCSWHVLLNDRGRIEWRSSPLPVNIASSIKDIELDSEGERLYILSQNSIYSYAQETGLREFEVALADEALVVIRGTSDPDKVLVGGEDGTVLLVDLASAQWYILDSSKKGAAIKDIWWISPNRIAFLNAASLLRVGRVSPMFPENRQQEDEGQEVTPYHVLKVGKDVCLEELLEGAEHRLRAGDRIDALDTSGNTILHRLGLQWYGFLKKREPIDLFLKQIEAHLLKRFIQELSSKVSRDAAENRIKTVLLCCLRCKIPQIAVKLILKSSAECMRDIGLMICFRHLKSRLSHEQLSQEGLLLSELYPLVFDNFEAGEVLDMMSFPMQDLPVLDTLLNNYYVMLPLKEPVLDALRMSTTFEEFKRAMCRNSSSLKRAEREVDELIDLDNVAQGPTVLLRLPDLIEEFFRSGQLAKEKVSLLLLLLKKELLLEMLLIKNHKGQRALDRIVEAQNYFE